MSKSINEMSLLELSQFLSKHVNNQDFFRELQFCTYSNKTIEDNLYGKNLRRIYYSDCKFQEANLHRAGFSGSIFSNCYFKNVNFKNTNLNQCKFLNCYFTGTITGANFDNSEFDGCYFENCKIKDTLFSNSLFYECTFQSGEWLSVFLESASFIKTKLHGISFSKLNFEFSYMDATSFDNCVLPFQAIPYMIGGFSIVERAEKLFIKSNTKKRSHLSIAEYFELLPYLEAFYVQTNNHFPLANIYIYQNELAKAYNTILAGIKYSISIDQHRLVQHYCDLFLKTKKFTVSQRALMSKDILEIISPFIENNISPYMRKYMLEVRNKLAYFSDNACSIVTIKTNIPQNNLSDVNKILTIIEPILTETNIRYHYEIRHNSPYEIAVILLDNLPDILSLIASLSTIIASIMAYKKGKKASAEKKNSGCVNNIATNGSSINNASGGSTINNYTVNITQNIIQVMEENNIDIEFEITNFNK